MRSSTSTSAPQLIPITKRRALPNAETTVGTLTIKGTGGRVAGASPVPLLVAAAGGARARRGAARRRRRLFAQEGCGRRRLPWTGERRYGRGHGRLRGRRPSVGGLRR